MTFDKIKKIYLSKKKETVSHNFIKEIFDEIKTEYKKEKRKEGKDANQSWNSWSGKALQGLIKFIVEDYVFSLKVILQVFFGVCHVFGMSNGKVGLSILAR